MILLVVIHRARIVTHCCRKINWFAGLVGVLREVHLERFSDLTAGRRYNAQPLKTGPGWVEDDRKGWE